MVHDYEYSETGVGYIDIVYFNLSGDEIYEVKTVNEPPNRYWAKTKYGTPTGSEQRQAYIKACKDAGNTVNENGTSLLLTRAYLILCLSQMTAIS